MNPRLKRPLFALLAAGLVLGGAEGLARLLRGPPPELLVAPERQQQAFSVNEGRVRPLFQGPFRAGDFDLEPAGQRVVVLGGSTVRAGAEPQLGADGEFPALLERALGVEVLNLGVPGAVASDLLERMPEVLSFQPDVVLVYSGHNAYVMASQLGLREELGPAQALLALALRNSRLFLLVNDLVAEAPAPDGQPPRFELDAAARERVRAEHVEQLDELLGLASEVGVPVVLSTVASNPFTPPIARDCPEVFAQLGLQAPRIGSENDPVDLAGLRLEQTDELDLDCLQARYVRGRLLWDAGRHEEAREHLDAVRDLERLPMRAERAMNEDLRALARSRDVPLVDADRAFRDHGLGLEPPTWMADVLHPNAAGHQALAALFAPLTAELLGLPDPGLEMPSTAPVPPAAGADGSAPPAPPG